MIAEDRLIVALDVNDMKTALEAVNQLAGTVNNFKIGGYLFTTAGPDSVKAVKEAGGEVFLDLKLHDIPSTVGNVSRAICSLGVKMFDIHASGGSRMIRSAVDSVSNSVQKPLVLAVTVLTHFENEMLRTELGVVRNITDHVLALASIAVESGADGIICSPHEIAPIRREFGDKITIVTPGIRPEGSDLDDQIRVFTPAEAVGEGADYIVVGRPIMNSPDKRKAAENIIRSMDG